MPQLSLEQIETADRLLGEVGFSPITAAPSTERYYHRYYQPQEGQSILRVIFTGEFEIAHLLAEQELKFRSQTNPDNIARTLTEKQAWQISNLGHRLKNSMLALSSAAPDLIYFKDDKPPASMKEIRLSDLPVVNSVEELESLRAVVFHDLYDYSGVPKPIQQQLADKYGAFWEKNGFYLPITLVDAPGTLLLDLKKGRPFDLLPNLPSAVMLGYPVSEAVQRGRFLNAESLLDAKGKLIPDVKLGDTQGYWVTKFLK